MDLTPDAKRAFHVQSYGPGPSIDRVELVELKQFSDDGGTMTELARLGRDADATDPAGRRPRRLQRGDGAGAHHLLHRPPIRAGARRVRRGPPAVGLRRPGRLGRRPRITR